MANLTIKPTQKTPEVVFDFDSGVFKISGYSIPEDSVGFYTTVWQWMDENKGLLSTANPTFEFELIYFNTSSTKCILDIFRRLNVLYKDGASMRVTWYYEEDDDDMRDTGEDYKVLLEIPFELVERN